MHGRWYDSKTLCDWTQLIAVFERHAQEADQWVFRGHSNSTWKLQPTLERALTRAGLHQEAADQPPLYPAAVQIEKGLVRKFQRESHRFQISHSPADDDNLEWFAWMRHYGAPTRLLDCSYSFFVAAFMALANAESESAVWAFNTTRMAQGLQRMLEVPGADRAKRAYYRDPSLTRRSTFHKLFMAESPLKLVGSVNPQKLNERLVVQQGVFLCPGDVSVPFETNLRAVLDGCQADRKDLCIKYCIPGETSTRRDILRHLLRMNISQASLFPGLEGFAGSLWQWLVFPEFITVDPSQ